MTPMDRPLWLKTVHFEQRPHWTCLENKINKTSVQIMNTLVKAEMKRIKALSRPSSPHAKNSFTDSDTLDGVEQMPRKNRMSNMNHRYDSPSMDGSSMTMTQAQLDQKTFEIVKESISKPLVNDHIGGDGAREQWRTLNGAEVFKPD